MTERTSFAVVFFLKLRSLAIGDMSYGNDRRRLLERTSDRSRAAEVQAKPVLCITIGGDITAR